MIVLIFCCTWLHADAVHAVQAAANQKKLKLLFQTVDELKSYTKAQKDI